MRVMFRSSVEDFSSSMSSVCFIILCFLDLFALCHVVLFGIPGHLDRCNLRIVDMHGAKIEAPFLGSNPHSRKGDSQILVCV